LEHDEEKDALFNTDATKLIKPCRKQLNSYTMNKQWEPGILLI